MQKEQRRNALEAQLFFKKTFGRTFKSRSKQELLSLVEAEILGEETTEKKSRLLPLLCPDSANEDFLGKKMEQRKNNIIRPKHPIFKMIFKSNIWVIGQEYPMSKFYS